MYMKIKIHSYFCLMSFLRDKESWQKAFFRLPILLRENLNNSFVMQNGVSGDFCISFEDSINDKFSTAWSSNTKNFILVDKDSIILYNWLRAKEERISLKAIAENINSFDEYLHTVSQSSYENAVQFTLKIFNEIRNEINDKANGEETLTNLLFIITNGEYKDSTLKKSITNKYIEKFSNGLKQIHNLIPDTNLIVRHSSGQLFYEAHQEIIYFNKQIDLWGNILDDKIIKNNQYSSVHYTPTYLSRTIVENAIGQINLKNKKIKIFDPACGSSEFLSEAIKQLQSLNYKGIIEVIGWDISKIAILTSNFVLNSFKKELGNKLDITIKLVENSLTEVWDRDYDLILMNPPFISWELLDTDKERTAVRETLGEYYDGKPNMAAAFFAKTIHCLNNDGILGCVIPSSILTFDAYKKLRIFCSKVLRINLVGKLGNYVFSNALTDISCFIATKTTKDSGNLPIVLWTNNEKDIPKIALTGLKKMQYSLLSKIDEAGYSIYKSKLNPENYNVNSFKNNEIFLNIEELVSKKLLVRVKDVFNVQQGIRTGNNDIFKVEKGFYENLSAKEKKYFRLNIDNSTISEGKLTLQDYVWYPYDKDGILIKSETELKNLSNSYFNKIKIFKDILSSRARKSSKDWWTLSEPRNWQFKKYPKLISTEFGKAGSFAYDAKGDAVVERGNGWLTIKEVEDEDFYFFYLAIFNSTFFTNLLLIYCKQLAGGSWYDLSKKYTQNIPVPNFDSFDKEDNIYKRIINVGKNLHEGKEINQKDLTALIKIEIYKIGK